MGSILMNAYLLESDRVIKMLRKTLLAIVVNIDSDRIDEVFFHNFLLYHFVRNLVGPCWRIGHVFSHSCSDIRARLAQLTTSPRVTIAKEKLCSLDFGRYDRWLYRHLQEFI
jgi:hypothetical protein